MKCRIALAPGLTTILLLLAGCRHSSKVTHVAPLAVPVVGPVMVSVPPPTHHDQPELAVSVVPSPLPPVPEPIRRHAKTARKGPAASAAPVTSQTAQTASATPPAPPITLGELSAGGEGPSGLRQQTADLLKAQQQRLEAINQAVLSAYPTEVAQAKTFLQRANTSWSAADYEGAHTLVVKAKVLLDDLKH